MRVPTASVWGFTIQVQISVLLLKAKANRHLVPFYCYLTSSLVERSIYQNEWNHYSEWCHRSAPARLTLIHIHDDGSGVDSITADGISKSCAHSDIDLRFIWLASSGISSERRCGGHWCRMLFCLGRMLVNLSDRCCLCEWSSWTIRKQLAFGTKDRYLQSHICWYLDWDDMFLGSCIGTKLFFYGAELYSISLYVLYVGST